MVTADREGTVPLAPGLSSGDDHSSVGQKAAPSKGDPEERMSTSNPHAISKALSGSLMHGLQLPSREPAIRQTQDRLPP